MTTPSPLYQLAVPGVQKLVPYVPGKPIEELQRELGLERVVKLASNENPLGPSKKALAAIQRVLSDLALYPDGSGFNLKNALSRKYGVDPAQITLGNGSNEILELVARAFLAPGVNAVFSQHAFAVYPIVIQATGAESLIAPAVNFGQDLQALRERVGQEIAASDWLEVAQDRHPGNDFADLKAKIRFQGIVIIAGESQGIGPGRQVGHIRAIDKVAGAQGDRGHKSSLAVGFVQAPEVYFQGALGEQRGLAQSQPHRGVKVNGLAGVNLPGCGCR